MKFEDLPRFNEAEALAGQPFIHIYDFAKGLPPHTIALRIDSGHPALLLYSGEWLVYEDADELMQQWLYDQFRMWREA